MLFTVALAHDVTEMNITHTKAVSFVSVTALVLFSNGTVSSRQNGYRVLPWIKLKDCARDEMGNSDVYNQILMQPFLATASSECCKLVPAIPRTK